MPNTTHTNVEKCLLALIADSGLPAPEEIQHEPTCMRAIWRDQKVAVVIDFEDLPDRDPNAQEPVGK